MRIPDEKIQEVRDAVSIVDVVSQYVSLKPRGKSFLGLCPFHQERTPSFTVDPVRGFYHCFGCGAGGDVFSFVMKQESVGFLEAVKTLAERARIPLPTYEKDEGRNQEIELLYQANQVAAEFYRFNLWKTEGGKKALQYILKRGFLPKTLETFQIGYSPELWDGLIKKAEQSGVKADALFRAGLAVPRKDGKGYYDRFRGRLMFPIFNVSGRVVGFGGRILGSEEGVPKYINTSETPIYQKGQILYGLFQCRNGIRRENRVLLVEGYTDMMRFFQCGFDYAVASSGTALTDGQARLLSRYTQNVMLVFDGDSAGMHAAIRGVDIVLAAGLRVQVAALPKGADPDSFLLKQDVEAMRQCLRQSYTFVDFQLKQIREKSRFTDSRDKVSAARNLLATVSKIRDPLERQISIKDIAEKLDMDEGLMLQELKWMTAPESKPASPKNGYELSGRREKAETGLLAFLLIGEEKWAEFVFQTLEPEDFKGPETQQFYKELLADFLSGNVPDANRALDRMRDNAKSAAFVSRLLSEEIVQGTDVSQFGLDCLLRLIEEKHEEYIRAIRKKLKLKASGGEEQIMQEWLQAKKVLENVKVEIISRWKKIVEI